MNLDVVNFQPLFSCHSTTDPHNVTHHGVEVSFDYYISGNWIVLQDRGSGHKIALSLEEQAKLASLIVERHPLDVLAGVKKD
jgi:hypothetical protein